jgi:hypothetical protein
MNLPSGALVAKRLLNAVALPAVVLAMCCIAAAGWAVAADP